MATNKKIISLSELRKLGVFQVKLEGEACTAPFSKKSCVWYTWIYQDKNDSLLDGFTLGKRSYNDIMIRTPLWDIKVSPSELQPYVAASFLGDVFIGERRL
jgi:hypothetical protein